MYWRQVNVAWSSCAVPHPGSERAMVPARRDAASGASRPLSQYLCPSVFICGYARSLEFVVSLEY